MTMARMYDGVWQRAGKYHRYWRVCAGNLRRFADVHGTDYRNVHQTCSTVPTLVDLDTATALGMAAAELVTNCYVHAFPDGKGGTIDVSLSASESGEGVLVIKDMELVLTLRLRTNGTGSDW